VLEFIRPDVEKVKVERLEVEKVKVERLEASTKQPIQSPSDEISIRKLPRLKGEGGG